MNGMTYIGMACHFLRDEVCDTGFRKRRWREKEWEWMYEVTEWIG